MSLLAIELNDTGIMAAAGQPAALLQIDGAQRRSPGFALPQKKNLLVGRAAAAKAHLVPGQILNRFWDQLSADPLETPAAPGLQNNAEIAYQHLARIWQHVKSQGTEAVMAVPSFYDRRQLGLILGMAQEMAMPLSGFLAQAVAASATSHPGAMLLHLDIYLHRAEIVYLEQGRQLTIADSRSIADQGLLYLYRLWVEAIAREFVRTTRFDPFHQAATEQHLYDRLPDVLAELRQQSTATMEIGSGGAVHGVTLTLDRILDPVRPFFQQIVGLIESLREVHGHSDRPVLLQLSDRFSRLPGCRPALAAVKDCRIVTLEPGAAACGVLAIWERLREQEGDKEGVSFFTSRPWQTDDAVKRPAQPAKRPTSGRPTHVLYGSIAYPLARRPLVVRTTNAAGRSRLQIKDAVDGTEPGHCVIRLDGDEAVLENRSGAPTFVDETRVTGRVVVKCGQIIRIGSPGQRLQLITCLERHET